MTDFSHLSAIENRIYNEEMRLLSAMQGRDVSKNGSRMYAKFQNEIVFREREIAAAKKEEVAERKFLGLPDVGAIDTMSLDDILAELEG